MCNTTHVSPPPTLPTLTFPTPHFPAPTLPHTFTFPHPHSATNVKKWESEMTTLKNNNARLTAALEESTQHVAQWKTMLQKYKEENDQYKRKVSINSYSMLVNSSDDCTCAPCSYQPVHVYLVTIFAQPADYIGIFWFSEVYLLNSQMLITLADPRVGAW